MNKADEIKRKYEELSNAFLVQLKDFEHRLDSNIVETLAVNYNEVNNTLDTKPFNVRFEDISIDMKIPLIGDTQGLIADEVKIIVEGSFSIEILHSFICNLSTFFVFKVSCFNDINDLILNFFNPKNREASKVFLLDERNGEYYYPIASSLEGQIVKNFSKVGIIAFQAFRKTPGICSINFYNIDKGEGKVFDHFKLETRNEIPDGLIGGAKWNRSVILQIREQILSKIEKEKADMIKKNSKSHLGCIFAIILVVIIIWYLK